MPHMGLEPVSVLRLALQSDAPPTELPCQPVCYAIRRSWFARVNALCNLSRKKSREVAAHFRADF